MSVSRERVAECMNGWMRGWVKQHFVPLEARAGGDRIVGPGNSVLTSVGVGTGKTDRLPDFVLPMNPRFASWQLVSWDGWETKQTNDLRTLAGSAALAILVGLLGIGIFVQQRRALKLAEQRVSFINRVSHELRAPLTNILLNVDLAADDLNEQEESLRRLALVQEEGHRLSRLIDNVLTFSRHEQKRLTMHPRPCVPADVIGAVLEQFSAALERRSIRVELVGTIAESCVFDPDAFSQILTNLVSNVEKYAADGAYLGIASKLEGGRLTVTVTDRGAGIPAAEAEKVFRPFYRMRHEVSEGATGTGLGLSIARELASRMGGELRLRPSDIGAVFELWIPIVHNSEAAT
jgi:signal transduction histidine kinase